MPISPPALRGRKVCKCGCGGPPVGRSAYGAGCFAVLKICRYRLWKLKHYARIKKVTFDLTLDWVRDKIGRLPDVGKSITFERIDTNKGYSPDNLILKTHKGRSGEVIRRSPPASEVHKMLSWLVNRQLKRTFGDQRPLGVNDVVRIYGQQEGRCYVSGVPLVLDKALNAESLALTRVDPLKPWSANNTIVTTLATKQFIDKWGVKYLTKVAKQITKKRMQERLQENG